MKRDTCFGHAALILSLLVLVGPLPAGAAERVEFNSAGSAPSPFQIRRAKAQGRVLEPEPGTPLAGLLYRPDGTGPFPGIVMLHDCRGIRPYQEAWAEELSSWGYVALLVDSFGPRGYDDICATAAELHYSEVVGGRLADVFGARAYLASLPFVDAGRIAVFGWAGIVLKPVFDDTRAQGYEGRFQAAVAFYPYCPLSRGDDLDAPVLVLVGDSDDSVRPDYCQRMAAASADRPVRVELVLYPGVLRGFDDPEAGERLYLEDAYNPNKTPALGMTLGYDRAAHEDSRERVKGFLARVLR